MITEKMHPIFNSDALIHDCGSFPAEYFYTNHPQLHMFRSGNTIDKEFSIFGKEISNYVYKAFSKQDIIGFTDNVVVKREDTMQDKRLEFAKNEIRINHTNATKKVMEILKYWEIISFMCIKKLFQIY